MLRSLRLGRIRDIMATTRLIIAKLLAVLGHGGSHQENNSKRQAAGAKPDVQGACLNFFCVRGQGKGNALTAQECPCPYGMDPADGIASMRAVG
jgi:hypothetical protein